MLLGLGTGAGPLMMRSPPALGGGADATGGAGLARTRIARKL